MFLSDNEEKDYYDKAEQEVRSMSKYDYPEGTSQDYWQPPSSGGSGCPFLVLGFMFKLAALISLTQLIS